MPKYSAMVTALEKWGSRLIGMASQIAPEDGGIGEKKWRSYGQITS